MELHNGYADRQVDVESSISMSSVLGTVSVSANSSEIGPLFLQVSAIHDLRQDFADGPRAVVNDLEEQAVCTSESENFLM